LNGPEVEKKEVVLVIEAVVGAKEMTVAFNVERKDISQETADNVGIQEGIVVAVIVVETEIEIVTVVIEAGIVIEAVGEAKEMIAALNAEKEDISLVTAERKAEVAAAEEEEDQDQDQSLAPDLAQDQAHVVTEKVVIVLAVNLAAVLQKEAQLLHEKILQEKLVKVQIEADLLLQRMMHHKEWKEYHRLKTNKKQKKFNSFISIS